MYTILLYHTIADYEGILPAGINTPIEVFRSHMDYLLEHEYRVCTLDQIVEDIILGRKQNNKTVAMTFDDGYEDHFINVYPILEMYGFPATIFLTVRYINGYWESEKAPRGKIRSLSRNQILEMQSGGIIRFGSHGYSHRNLLDISEGEKIIEIRDSKLYLEDLLGRDVPFISYPFGAFDGEVTHGAMRAGYKAGFSVWNRKADIYSLPRVPLHARDGLKRFRFKLSPLYHPAKSILRLT